MNFSTIKTTQKIKSYIVRFIRESCKLLYMNLICDYTHMQIMCIVTYENYIQQFTYDSRMNQGTYDNHKWHICQCRLEQYSQVND